MSKDLSNSSPSRAETPLQSIGWRSRLHPLRLVRDVLFLVLFCGALYAGARMTDLFSDADDQRAQKIGPLRDLFRQAESDYDNGDFDAAADKYREVVFEMPERGGLWMRYGDALHQAGRYEEAIKAFKTATSFDRQTGNGNLWIARGYARLNDKEMALTHLEKAAKSSFPATTRRGDFDDFASLADDPQYQRLRRNFAR